MTVTPAASRSELLRALMAGYQEGSAESFDELYAALAPPLRRYLLRHVRDVARAEDLLQDVFLQIHRARRTYDPALPVEPWAFAIARHVFLMHCRTTGRRREVPLEGPGAELASGAPSREDVEVARDELERALARLSPKRREVVLLHHHVGLGFDEIGGRLGIRANAARLQASRGLRMLRALLRGNGR